MTQHPSIFNSTEIISEGERFLSEVDPDLRVTITSQKLKIPTPESDYFYALCSSIISQQVSLAAARTIFSRFETLTKCDPKIVNVLSIDELRAVGLSRQKASYIYDLSAHFLKDPGVYKHLENLDDDKVITELTNVKGIGVWTAQMFLIFTLGRPDIFAPADAGLQRAIMLSRELSSTPPPKDLLAMAENWTPYRTIASLHLWQSLDT